MWELDPLVTGTDKLDVGNTTDDVGGWYINEELHLAYFSVFASDSVPVSYTHLTLPTIYSV